MSPEKLSQVKEIVLNFLDKEPTDKDVIDYCTEKGFDFIDIGTLEDYTLQYRVDETAKIFMEIISRSTSSMELPSGFESNNDQQGHFRATEKIIFDEIVKLPIRLDVASNALLALSRVISDMIKNVESDITKQQGLVANTFIYNQFGGLPREVNINEYAKFIDETRKVLDEDTSLKV